MRAILRAIPDSFTAALAAVRPDPPIDVSLARAQQAVYRQALEGLGVAVTMLPALEACPDCCFVEDTAVVAEGLAVITRPGAPSRRAETPAVAAALTGLDLVQLEAPATLDGGDCLRLGRTLYVGRSARTNAEGIAALDRAFRPRGVRVVPVDLPPGILHLKCVCSPLDEGRVLLARDTLAPSTFGAAGIVWVPAEERYAANAVAVGRHALVAEGHPRTLDALAAAGLTPHPVPTSEVRKADGSLTCQSLLLDTVENRR